MTSQTEHQYDPLLECIAIVARLFNRPVSIESLTAGFPVKPGSAGPELFTLGSSKGLFTRVAKRAGLAARLVRRDLDQISDLLLPCVLILNDHNACVLESIDQEEGKAKIIVADIHDGEEWIDIAELNDQYLGFCFLLKQEYQHKRKQNQMISVRDGHWFWGTILRSKEIYASVLLASVLINLFVLATPMFTMNVYDRVVPNHAIETLWVLAIGVGSIYLFDTLLRFIRNYLLEMSGKKCDVIMSSILFEQVMNLRMEHWPKSTGAFASRLNQFESIRNFFTSSTLITLVDLPFSLLFLAAVAYIGDALVAIPLITIGLLLTYSLLLVRPLRRSIESVVGASAQKHSMLVESLHSIQTIKALGASRYAQWAWEETSGEIASKSLKTRMLSGSISVVTGILTQVNMVAIVIFGVYQIIDLELTMGALIAVVILASRAIAPMAQAAALITSYQQTKTAFASLDELMNQEVERPEGSTFVRRPHFEGAIEFRKVSFTYPETENASLSNFSIKIAPGEHVGIIGRVGSGKTTMSKLILGLYSANQGSVSIDGIDINQIDPADLRLSVSYLSQDIELIGGSIRENIVLKNTQANDDAVLKAAQVAGVDLFVNKMSKGFDTNIGEKGMGLSGGQRQCLALARTVLQEEPIIILDEPTNSMDNTTESIIRQNLFDYTRDKTLLLITHKAPMLDLVERLVVVEDGCVIMDGPKAEILNTLQGRRNAA